MPEALPMNKNTNEIPRHSPAANSWDPDFVWKYFGSQDCFAVNSSRREVKVDKTERSAEIIEISATNQGLIYD
jgi:hypothetical protein